MICSRNTAKKIADLRENARCIFWNSAQYVEAEQNKSVSEMEYVALFLRFLRQSFQIEFQPRVDLKMYLNSWTTQTCYFHYSDISRNL